MRPTDPSDNAYLLVGGGRGNSKISGQAGVLIDSRLREAVKINESTVYILWG